MEESSDKALIVMIIDVDRYDRRWRGITLAPHVHGGFVGFTTRSRTRTGLIRRATAASTQKSISDGGYVTDVVSLLRKILSIFYTTISSVFNFL